MLRASHAAVCVGGMEVSWEGGMEGFWVQVVMLQLLRREVENPFDVFMQQVRCSSSLQEPLYYIYYHK